MRVKLTISVFVSFFSLHQIGIRKSNYEIRKSNEKPFDEIRKSNYEIRVAGRIL